jgi:hypothetical protein
VRVFIIGAAGLLDSRAIEPLHGLLDRLAIEIAGSER